MPLPSLRVIRMATSERINPHGYRIKAEAMPSSCLCQLDPSQVLDTFQRAHRPYDSRQTGEAVHACTLAHAFTSGEIPQPPCPCSQ